MVYFFCHRKDEIPFLKCHKAQRKHEPQVINDDVGLVTLISFPAVEVFHGDPEPKRSGPRASANMPGKRDNSIYPDIYKIYI